MRLTLRTLLAYLDDILEPAQAREIGEKLQDSTFATSLVEKIQDVVRRRRIGAPALSGPGSKPDPNLVAEYLDNTLPPDAVAEVERICLESDVHLAEVAACHQVLTLVLGEAVDVPAPLREQMYSLGAIAEPPDAENGDGVKHTPKVVGVGAADAKRKPRPSNGDLDLSGGPTPVLPKRTPWKRTLPFAIGAVILAGWAYIIFTDPAMKSGFLAQREPSQDVQAPQVAPPPGANDDPAPRQPPDGEPADFESGDAPIEVELQEDSELAQTRSDVAPPAPAPEITQPSASTDLAPPSSPAPDEALAAAHPASLTPDPAESESPSPPVPEAVPPSPASLDPFQVQYSNMEGVLLRHDEPGDVWTLLPRRSLIYPGEEIAAPEPFDARLTLADETPVCEVLLKGGTRVRTLEPTSSSRFGLSIDQGRLLISTYDSQDLPAIVIQLKIRGDEWTCELLETHTVMAIEVVPELPTHVGDLSGQSRYQGGMQLVSGAARLTLVADQRVLELAPERSVLMFASAAEGFPAEPVAALTVPDWALPNATIPPLARLYATKYEKEFLTDQPLSASIRPVVKDRQPRLSELATRTLALTGSIPGLVDGLSAAHQESRIAAIVGLQQWLSGDPEHAELLQAELQNRFSDADSAAVLRMLWGYGPQDGHDKFHSQELVNWMLHEEVAIRELAAHHVLKLTNRSLGYRADRRPDEREAIVKRWQKDLDRTGSLLGTEPSSGDVGAETESDTKPAQPDAP